jgi:hypothetical protein
LGGVWYEESRNNPVIPWYLSGGAAVPLQANRFIGKADFAAAKVNEVNPGIYDLTDGAHIPTWATGTGALFIAGDTNTQYLRTGITSVPIGGDVTAFVAFTVNDSTPTDTIFGSLATGAFFAQLNNGAGIMTLCNGNSLTDTALTSGTHTLAIAGDKAYLNGTALAGTLTKNAITSELYLGALNYGGSAIQGCGSYITHWAFWNSVLTSAQIAAIHAGI